MAGKKAKAPSVTRTGGDGKWPRKPEPVKKEAPLPQRPRAGTFSGRDDKGDEIENSKRGYILPRKKKGSGDA